MDLLGVNGVLTQVMAADAHTAKTPHPLDVSVDNVVFGSMESSFRSCSSVKDFRRRHVPGPVPHGRPGDLVYQVKDSMKRPTAFCRTWPHWGIFLKQFKTFGDPNRVFDKKDREWLTRMRPHPERRVVSIGYYSLVALAEYTPRPSSFASRAEWCPLSDIPRLAFDHNAIIAAGLEQLREDVAHRGIIFELLPEKFTLGQLQRLHEIILDKDLDKRNFRKNVKRLEGVIALDE